VADVGLHLVLGLGRVRAQAEGALLEALRHLDALRVRVHQRVVDGRVAGQVGVQQLDLGPLLAHPREHRIQHSGRGAEHEHGDHRDGRCGLRQRVSAWA
jgi:hypothetical protein